MPAVTLAYDVNTYTTNLSSSFHLPEIQHCTGMCSSHQCSCM